MTITHWLLIGIIIGLLIYDALVNKFGVPTESQVLRDWGQKFTALPFTAGFLLGHWFFNHVNLWTTGWMYALPLFIGLGAWDGWWWANNKALGVWYRYPGLWASLGILAGHFLWGQHP
jgi:hypothetical protein